MIQALPYMFLYALLNVSGAALIKSRLQTNPLSSLQEWWKFISDSYFILGFLLVFASALALFKALSSGNLSLVIPYASGLNFILTFFIARYFFHDSVSTYALLGMFFIVLGIFFLSINNSAYGQQDLAK